MAATMWLISVFACPRMALFLALESAGSSMPARMPMIAMTTSISISVKADFRFRAGELGLFIILVWLARGKVSGRKITDHFGLVAPVADAVGLAADGDVDPQIVAVRIVGRVRGAVMVWIQAGAGNGIGHVRSGHPGAQQAEGGAGVAGDVERSVCLALQAGIIVQPVEFQGIGGVIDEHGKTEKGGNLPVGIGGQGFERDGRAEDGLRAVVGLQGAG